MFNIKNLMIGKKLLIAPVITGVFLVVIALFSNSALKSDKETLEDIVNVKFELYKSSSSILTEVNLFNSVLYKVFSFVTDGYAQSEIDKQLEVLATIQKRIEKKIDTLIKEPYLTSINKKNLLVVQKNIAEYNLTVKDAIDMALSNWSVNHG